ncbi:MAG: response regulator transcription factor [Anaerolineales bacterium]|nr:response regulator transcription factor [Anaerolineales bacterium]
MTKVLVIDDEPATTDLLTLLLKPQGFEVLTVHSGIEGLKIAQAQNPDIIILDLMMPGMDGIQVCSEMRRFTHSPILILSALDNPTYVAAALDAGADDYLVKPASSSLLIARINMLTRRAAENGKNGHAKLKTQPARAGSSA